MQTSPQSHTGEKNTEPILPANSLPYLRNIWHNQSNVTSMNFFKFMRCHNTLGNNWEENKVQAWCHQQATGLFIWIIFAHYFDTFLASITPAFL